MQGVEGVAGNRGFSQGPESGVDPVNRFVAFGLLLDDPARAFDPDCRVRMEPDGLARVRDRHQLRQRQGRTVKKNH